MEYHLYQRRRQLYARGAEATPPGGEWVFIGTIESRDAAYEMTPHGMTIKRGLNGYSLLKVLEVMPLQGRWQFVDFNVIGFESDADLVYVRLSLDAEIFSDSG